MSSFFVESHRFAASFGVALPDGTVEFEMTEALSPQVPSQAVLDMLSNGDTALWLDGECVLLDASFGSDFRHGPYEITVMYAHCRAFALCQAPGTAERGAPLPALEFFMNRVTSDERVVFLWIKPYLFRNAPQTLDVTPACFSNLLRTSRLVVERCGSVTLGGISLTAEQTTLLFTQGTSLSIDLCYCRFHGPTLLQLGSAALQREQTYVTGRDSYLDITLCETSCSASQGELDALLSNPHLRSLNSTRVSFEKAKKLVSALAANMAANKQTGLESLEVSEEYPELAEQVEALLEINRYRPKIAALCRTDPSTAAALLGQAIVAIARKKNMPLRCKREILRMLVEQLVLTGHNFGEEIQLVLTGYDLSYRNHVTL